MITCKDTYYYFDTLQSFKGNTADIHVKKPGDVHLKSRNKNGGWQFYEEDTESFVNLNLDKNELKMDSYHDSSKIKDSDVSSFSFLGESLVL
jgi:hypothetical protein